MFDDPTKAIRSSIIITLLCTYTCKITTSAVRNKFKNKSRLNYALKSKIHKLTVLQNAPPTVLNFERKHLISCCSLLTSITDTIKIKKSLPRSILRCLQKPPIKFDFRINKQPRKFEFLMHEEHDKPSQQ